MKQAVVFYSRDGNTRAAAKALGEKFGADLFELKETRQRSTGIGGFIAAGFGAATGRCSELEDTFADAVKAYEKVYIGTPVWAAKAVPAVNTFLKAFDPSGKEIVLFSVQADPSEGAPPSGITALKAPLEARGATVSAVVRLAGSTKMKQALPDDEMAKRVDAKF